MAIVTVRAESPILTVSLAMAWASGVTRRPLAVTYPNPSTSPRTRSSVVSPYGRRAPVGLVDGDPHHRPLFLRNTPHRRRPPHRTRSSVASPYVRQAPVGVVVGDHHRRPPFPTTASERSHPLVWGRWVYRLQRWDEGFRRWNELEYGMGLPVVGVPVSAPPPSRAME